MMTEPLGWVDKCELDVFLQPAAKWESERLDWRPGESILYELQKGRWLCWSISGPDGVQAVIRHRQENR